MSEDGHRYTWGAPAKGWPRFDENGKVVTPAEKARKRTDTALTKIDEALAEHGSVPAGDE